MRMRISDFSKHDFGDFNNYEIEDFDVLANMVIHMIEDTATITYSWYLAKERNDSTIQKDLFEEVISYLDRETAGKGLGQLESISENAIVAPTYVRGFSRVPIPCADETITLFSRFLNLHIIEMIRAAAELAASEGTQVIELRHFFPGCKKLPWPYNRIC